MSRYLFPADACLPPLPLHWPSPAVPWPPSLPLPLWVLGVVCIWFAHSVIPPTYASSLNLQFHFSAIFHFFAPDVGSYHRGLISKSRSFRRVVRVQELISLSSPWQERRAKGTENTPNSSESNMKWTTHASGMTIALPVYAVKCFLVVYECLRRRSLQKPCIFTKPNFLLTAWS